MQERTWDDDIYYSYEEPDRIRISGLCVMCPIPYADEYTTRLGVKATHKYNQLQPMCEKHYNEILGIVKSICG